MQTTANILPKAAAAEIMAELSAKHRISSDEIAAILKKHDVNGDMAALQDSYRKRLGQRFMAAIRDEGGHREILAAGRNYVIVDCCNDPKELKSIRKKFQNSVNGLDSSTEKVGKRLEFLDKFALQVGEVK